MQYKQQIEDFIVEEIIDLDQKPGNYLYVKLIKMNWNTLDVINRLKEMLHIQRSNIGFAGTKDKRGITTQYISIKNITKEQLERVRIKDVELEALHYGSKPISLGDHKANHFKIKLDIKPIQIDFIENYFGEQRFSRNNVEIGLAILKKDLKKAVSLIFPGVETTDFVKEIKKQDKKLISLYLNSVQSQLWNNVASDYLKLNYKEYLVNDNLIFIKKYKKNIKIPLIAFDTEFNDKVLEKLYNEQLKKYNLTKTDFITRSFPECLPLTDLRDLFVEIKDFKILENTLEFTLPKGSYATTVLKKLETFLKSNH